MEFDLGQQISRKGTHSIKREFIYVGDRLQHRGPDQTTPDGKPLLPLWVADMDFRCPPVVIEALIERASQGVFGYTYPTDSYFVALAGWIQRRQGWSLESEWVVLTPGIVTAMKTMVQTFTEPGDKVLIQPPVYHPFFYAIENNNRQVAANPLVLEGGRYRMDFDDLARQAADPAVKMAFLCSPHNPVGRVWTADELRRFGEICLDHDVLVVADEVYCDLIYPGWSFNSYAGLGERFLRNSVICRAASKSFNLAGLQTSNIIIPDPDRRENFRATIDRSAGFNVNTFGIVAAEAAYRHGEPWLEAVLDYVAGNFRFLKAFFERHMPQIKVIEPQGTYLTWVDFGALGLEAEDRKKMMMEQAGVILDEGEMFGQGGQGFERFNIACPRETLAEALERIREAVEAFSA